MVAYFAQVLATLVSYFEGVAERFMVSPVYNGIGLAVMLILIVTICFIPMLERHLQEQHETKIRLNRIWARHREREYLLRIRGEV